jgi:hypothetical protein
MGIERGNEKNTPRASAYEDTTALKDGPRQRPKLQTGADQLPADLLPLLHFPDLACLLISSPRPFNMLTRNPNISA